MLFPLTTQTVSELRAIAAAIRLGCAVRPVQSFGPLSYSPDSACTVIAAHMGGYSWLASNFGKQVRYFRFRRNPRGMPAHPTLYGVLICRNDVLKITRERSAAVLDRLARAYESAILATIAAPSRADSPQLIGAAS